MEFAEFFQTLHGYKPFPWQSRLADEVLASGWPDVLDLPTGTGKTAAIDIAVFHLVRQALEGGERTAPLRVFYVVDRRIVVDAAFRRARHMARELSSAKDGVLRVAARALQDRFHTGSNDEPLQAAMLRGGIYRDDGWARSALQPLVCVSTVDQVGSRLLFRGYGVSPSMRPIHAALVGCDSLVLVDEAHLSEPLLETLASVQRFSGPKWSERQVQRPAAFVRMSATTEAKGRRFGLADEDWQDDDLRKRLFAPRPAILAKPIRTTSDDVPLAEREFAESVATAAVDLGVTLRKHEPAFVMGVVVNRVRTARQVLASLEKRAGRDAKSDWDCILLTGRIRPFDRDRLLYREDVQGKPGWLSWMEAGRKVPPARPLFVVATQTIEVGADLDFDGLVTEAAALDALQQRFGRLNRLGDRSHARATILVRKDALAKRANDPVYGSAIAATWKWFDDVAQKHGRERVIDFELAAMQERLKGVDLEALKTLRAKAPIMLPAHLDAWCRTNPAPAADPDVSLFLHGPESGPADVNVVWRADLLESNERDSLIESSQEEQYTETVSQIPPTSLEACPVPLKHVRIWLKEEQAADDLSDVEGAAADEPQREQRKNQKTGRRVLRWLGPDESRVIDPDDLRPGDTIVVPSSYGGHDRFGWNPEWQRNVPDIAEACSRWGRGRPVLRLDARVVDSWFPQQRDARSDNDESEATTRGRAAATVARVPLALDIARIREDAVERGPSVDEIETLLDAYLSTPDIPDAVRRTAQELTEESNRQVEGWRLTGCRRLSLDGILKESGGPASEAAGEMEDAASAGDSSSFVGASVRVKLEDHLDAVAQTLASFLTMLRVPKTLASDLCLAARWHDIGKLDERFQKWLYGDEVAWAASGEPLAKSGMRDWSAIRRARETAGVPAGFRHETLSVQLLDAHESCWRGEASDAELVRYLVGSHHGHGRPFHPVAIDESPAGIEAVVFAQSFSVAKAARQEWPPLHRLDAEWPELFWRLIRRYGHWGLAWLECLLRLADQKRSREESRAETADSQRSQNERAEVTA